MPNRPKATCLTQKQGSTDILNADDSELDLAPMKDGAQPHNGFNALDPSGIPSDDGTPLGLPDFSPDSPSYVIAPTAAANGELSHLPHHVQSLHHSTNPHHHHNHLHHSSNASNHNSNGSNIFYHNNFDPSMTSSATSNTNSVGSSFDQFEAGHSRSNSSQTSSSRISTGFNSLPSHSRQGSADSENTANSRLVCAIIKRNRRELPALSH